MQTSKRTIDFLLGWLGSLFLYLVFWGWFPFFIALLYPVHIIVTISLWKTRRYVSFGLLFAMLFVAIPLVFGDWWKGSPIQYWFVQLGHSSIFYSLSNAWWGFVDLLVNTFMAIFSH